jgi:SAM-dependent methyltransferase
MRVFTSNLPNWFKNRYRRFRKGIDNLTFLSNRRYCPVCCTSSSRFRKFGRTSRKDARCPNCKALERHRLLWLYLQKETDLFSNKSLKVLHIAPEPCFESKLKERLGDNYLTADLNDPNVMVKMDITDIQYPENTFDVILCNHVLEHIPDDKRAMRELFRTLNDKGWAILLVPITSEKTYEDPMIIKPEDRLKAFGQEDHVRRYGPDYIDRLREAGFAVETIKIEDLVNKKDAVRMGLTPACGDIYYCIK